jgi:hypothetical protein
LLIRKKLSQNGRHIERKLDNFAVIPEQGRVNGNRDYLKKQAGGANLHAVSLLRGAGLAESRHCEERFLRLRAKRGKAIQSLTLTCW